MSTYIETNCIFYSLLDEINADLKMELTQGQDYCLIQRKDHDNLITVIMEIDLPNHEEESVDEVLSLLEQENKIFEKDYVLPFTFVGLQSPNILLVLSIPEREQLIIDTTYEVSIK